MLKYVGIWWRTRILPRRKNVSRGLPDTGQKQYHLSAHNQLYYPNYLANTNELEKRNQGPPTCFHQPSRTGSSSKAWETGIALAQYILTKLFYNKLSRMFGISLCNFHGKHESEFRLRCMPPDKALVTQNSLNVQKTNFVKMLPLSKAGTTIAIDGWKLELELADNRNDSRNSFYFDFIVGFLNTNCPLGFRVAVPSKL